MGMVEAGRVKLDELEVGDAGASPPGHGDPITRRDIGVAGVKIDLAGPAGGNDHKPGPHRHHLMGFAIEHIGPEDAPLGEAEFGSCNQVDGIVVLKKMNIGMLSGMLFQRRLNSTTRGIGGMHHPPMGMAAFAGQVQLMIATTRFHFGERDPLI